MFYAIFKPPNEFKKCIHDHFSQVYIFYELFVKVKIFFIVISMETLSDVLIAKII